MLVFRQSGSKQSGSKWVRGAMGAAVVVGLCGLSTASAGLNRTRTERVRLYPWAAAVKARQVLEAENSHTRVEYARVMDRFRAIYHGDPGDTHAARAVEQVAELLAEQGREFGDRKSLRDAAGQYEFLAKAYPGGGLAPMALGQALDLLGPDAAGDAVEARKVRAELENDYPRSAAARAVKQSAAVAAASTGAATPRPGRAGDDATVATVKVAGRKKNAGAKPESDEISAGQPAPIVREAAPDASGLRSPTSESLDHPVSAEVPETATPAGPAAMVTGIRHWSTSSYTRVAIDLGGEVQYEAARVEHPDRIFFDLHHAKLGGQLAGKSFAVTDDGFLTRIRAAQFSDDVTRVVLDVHEVTEYSAFLLPNPYRLIIDIHGRQGSGTVNSEQLTANSPVPPPAVVRIETGPRASSQGDGESPGVSAGVSSLPPMPVTDGSASFGLPARSADNGAAVAAPRVVIASKATSARPVPNTVATHSSATGTEVAAVSEQPGKVEATKRPTSQPIAEKSKTPRSGNRESEAEDVDADVPVKVVRAKTAKAGGHGTAAPAQAAAPTADGETSLVRALGLKIGRIVIDAGHGGHDSGTLGDGGIEEKDVVLDVALRLGKLLHDRLGAEIVYTRADDTFVPLETRTAIANKAQADLFISVHANSSPDASARGVEVYYLNFTSDPEAMRVAARENAVSTQSVHELSELVKQIALKDKIEESKELAGDVDASLYAGLEKGNDGLKNRGVKKAPFVVLIGANMPSILAEISFVTNPDDADQLRDPAYRERVAESLYRGVARYAAGINGKDGLKVERAAR